MAKELAIPGQPIPGDDLGPVESKELWASLQQKAKAWVGAGEDFAIGFAEWWDRKGAQHFKWGENAAGYVASVLGVNRSRVYQLVEWGRAKWHLSTAVDKSVVKRLSEWAMRPMMKCDPGIMPGIVVKAQELATLDAKRVAEKYGRPISDYITIKNGHMREAVKTLSPQQARVYRAAAEAQQLADEPFILMRVIVADLRGISTRVDTIARRSGEKSLAQLHKRLQTLVELADGVRRELEDGDEHLLSM